MKEKMIDQDLPEDGGLEAARNAFQKSATEIEAPIEDDTEELALLRRASADQVRRAGDEFYTEKAKKLKEIADYRAKVQKNLDKTKAEADPAPETDDEGDIVDLDDDGEPIDKPKAAKKKKTKKASKKDKKKKKKASSEDAKEGKTEL